MTLLPSIVKVAGQDIVLTQWSKNEARAEQCLGQFSGEDMAIRIDMDSLPLVMVDTLLHEVLHAAWYVYCLEEEDKEERIISVMGTALTQIFRDNPALLLWVQDTVRKATP